MDDDDKKRPARKKMLTPSGRLFWAVTAFGVFLAVTVPKMSWSGVADAGGAVVDWVRSVEVSTEKPTTQVAP